MQAWLRKYHWNKLDRYLENMNTITFEQEQRLGIIDVHHHILPPEYISSLAKLGIRNSGGISFPGWNPEKSLNHMDKNGIATAITSISSPGIYFGDSKFATNLAKKCNEFSAELVERYPGRFGGFAVLPMPDVEAALRELAFSLDVLKLDGVVLLTNIDGDYLGSAVFDEIFAELNRREAIVFIHPTVPANENLPNLKLPAAILEFVFDTTRAISNLILNNTFERFPNIKFIVSHAGGAAPYLASRISMLDYFSREEYETDTFGHLKNLYYDTALSAYPNALRSLQEVSDPSRILFGSDYPFAPAVMTSQNIEGLDEYSGLDSDGVKAVKRNNALKLFPRFISNGNVLGDIS